MRIVTAFSAACVVAVAAGIVAAPRAVAPPAAIDTALACQAKVVDAVRKAAGGKVFLTFDKMPSIDGANVSGPAMDRSFIPARAMSFKCAGANASFTYNDGRPAVKMDPRERFQSATTRNCETQVGTDFAAASLSASDTAAEYVIGLAANGSAKICTMDHSRVVSIK